MPSDLKNGLTKSQYYSGDGPETYEILLVECNVWTYLVGFNVASS